MSDALYTDFVWIQVALASTFFGVITILWGRFSSQKKLVRWGLIAFLLTGLTGIPIHYAGTDVMQLMHELNYAKEVIENFQMDYYTTLIVTFFLSITALMSLLMQRSLGYVPKIFLYPVVFYGLLVVAYLGWRSWHLFN